MSEKKYVCVYGGASDRISSSHTNEIEKLGKMIAKEGFSLVYGAGATGCMGAVARGTQQCGGYVMGVAPHFMEAFEKIYPCDNLVMVDTMDERKAIMEEHADIFVIAPGGVGTMDEFFQVLTLKILGRMAQPLLVLNLDGFYDKLLEFIDSLVDMGAVDPRVYSYFDVLKSVEDVREFLK